MITDPADLIAAWIAMAAGRPDLALQILISAPARRITTLHLVVSNGRLLDEPIAVTRVRI